MAIVDIFGGGSGGGVLERTENLTDQIDGERIVFNTTYEYQLGTLRVYVNGIRGIETITYTESGSRSFTLTRVLSADEYLLVDYVQQ